MIYDDFYDLSNHNLDDLTQIIKSWFNKSLKKKQIHDFDETYL